MITQREFMKDGKTRRCQMRIAKAYRSRSNIHGRQCSNAAKFKSEEGRYYCPECLGVVKRRYERDGETFEYEKLSN